MSTTVSTGKPATPPAQHGSVGFGAVLRSELTKLTSVRSTPWSLLALVVVMVGLTALVCAGGDPDSGDGPIETCFYAIAFGQVAAVVLGVLAISTEWSKGGMRTTLTAVPQRWRIVVAKVLVVFGVCFGVGLVAAFLSFFLGQALFSAEDRASLSDDGALRATIGAALYLGLSGLFGLGLGFVLRQSAGAITAGIVLLLVAPGLLAAIPGAIGHALEKYFTANAGVRIISTTPDAHTLGPWPGLLVFALWCALFLVVGAILLQRRDAA